MIGVMTSVKISLNDLEKIDFLINDKMNQINSLTVPSGETESIKKNALKQWDDLKVKINCLIKGVPPLMDLSKKEGNPSNEA